MIHTLKTTGPEYRAVLAHRGYRRNGRVDSAFDSVPGHCVFVYFNMEAGSPTITLAKGHMDQG